MRDAAGPWQRWWRLSHADKRIVLSLAWRLPAVDLSLRLLGLKRTRRWLLHRVTVAKAAPCNICTLEQARRLAALAAVLARHEIGDASCLRQALVVEQWLRRRGLAAELRIGVRKTPVGELDAHAWVELDGTALAPATPSHGIIADVSERLQ